MTAFSTFDELEARIPLSQLRPSIAFQCCAAHLPTDVDELHGDELVNSLTHALLINSKARVVLQCWVLLIMRRRTDARHAKDALYAHLQPTTVTPQEKIRYRRGAMLLCHLLIERETAGANALLDNYLTHFYFPWSTAVNEKDDGFYLEEDTVNWVRQAHHHWIQNGNRIKAIAWLALSRRASSLPTLQTPSAVASSSTSVPFTADDYTTVQPRTIVTSARSAFVPYHRRSNSSSRRATDATASTSSTAANSPLRTHPLPFSQTTKHKRRRNSSNIKVPTAAHRELATLKDTIGRWAKRLRRQLLQAAEDDDKEQIQQIANALQAPPLTGKAEAHAGVDLPTDGSDSDHDDESSSVSEDDSISESSQEGEKQSEPAEECSVCAEEPKRLAQVRNVSCTHSFCNQCMFDRLSQRVRRCIYCRVKITQVVDMSGRVFQHYEWTRWWQDQRCVSMV